LIGVLGMIQFVSTRQFSRIDWWNQLRDRASNTFTTNRIRRRRSTVAQPFRLLTFWSIAALMSIAPSCRGAGPALESSQSGVVAETPIGNVPMPQFGNLHQTGDALSIRFENDSTRRRSWNALPKVSRILGVLVTSSAVETPELRVWLWRGQTPNEPNDWVDITGGATIARDRTWRIAFRDIAGDRTFQRWLAGPETPSVKLMLHRHDDGFAIEVAPANAADSEFAVGFGSPEAAIYAVRLGR
jgi:hypothetical protein